ncbi:exported protein of unknown function [Xenorhabdus poinarii G6]|uniref:Uncharacterized protein n=1 Tax=Xenorhabdus poinarii G6 TaxID=1354304 RepID=A0A068R604_9GAMM|nr:hypothetical protein [Xenorhabdus poinarii]CDG21555.1 exported protein of unknown function [Xenorhabdus poinarii G6]
MKTLIAVCLAATMISGFAVSAASAQTSAIVIAGQHHPYGPGGCVLPFPPFPPFPPIPPYPGCPHPPAP